MEDRLRVISSGDFHGGNFTAVAQENDVPIMVNLDLSSMGNYPVGEDLFRLTYSALGSAGWRPEFDWKDPIALTDFLFNTYSKCLKAELVRCHMAGVADVAVKQARENLAVSWAISAQLMADWLDPKYTEHFGGAQLPGFKEAMVRGLKMSIAFADEAFAVQPTRMQTSSVEHVI